VTLPLRAGRGGGMEEPAPRRKHPERQVGESYPDALSRVAGERDAALRDVARLAAQVAAVEDLAADIPDLLQTYAWSHPGGAWIRYAEFVAERIRAALADVPGPAGEKPR
jgi:hypothetical protein